MPPIFHSVSPFAPVPSPGEYKLIKTFFYKCILTRNYK